MPVSFFAPIKKYTKSLRKYLFIWSEKKLCFPETLIPVGAHRWGAPAGRPAPGQHALDSRIRLVRD